METICIIGAVILACLGAIIIAAVGKIRAKRRRNLEPWEEEVYKEDLSSE